MEICLVTKLKAAVNNPDLPYLETMQQFTLDAIAASGNNSMTDEQKWALNHFFYQIGAITNSAPYTKLQVIGLPIIASSLSTAVNNYKSGGSVAGNIRSGLVFSNGMITAPNHSSGRAICDFTVTGKDNKSFSLISGNGKASIGIAGANRTYTSTLTEAVFQLIPSPRTQYTSVAYTALSSSKVLGAFNLSETDVKCWLGDLSDVQELTPSIVHMDELLGEDFVTTTPYSAGVDYGTYGFIYGTGLTNEEALLVTTAFKELFHSFVSVE